MLGVCAAVYGIVLVAAPGGLPEVATDRPDLANGTFTVAPAAWQLEIGGDMPVFREHPDDSPGLVGSAALRIGVHDRVELRLFDGDSTPWFDRSDPDRGGFSFGFKARFNDLVEGRNTPSFGLQVYGVRGLSRYTASVRAPAFGGIFIWTQPVASWFGFDFNLGTEVYPKDGYRTAGTTTTAAFSGVFTTKVDITPYVEVFGQFGPGIDRKAELGADGGMIVKLSRRVAVDFAARIGLVTTQREMGVMTGFTWLFADGSRWRARSTHR